VISGENLDCDLLSLSSGSRVALGLNKYMQWVITTGQVLAVSSFYFGGQFGDTVHLSWSQHSCNDLATLLYCSKKNVLPCYDPAADCKEDPFRGRGKEGKIDCFFPSCDNQLQNPLLSLVGFFH
jgi:hypothetical protein